MFAPAVGGSRADRDPRDRGDEVSARSTPRESTVIFSIPLHEECLGASVTGAPDCAPLAVPLRRKFAWSLPRLCSSLE